MKASRPPRGRGAISNPPNRFERISFERDLDWDPEDEASPRTEFFQDHSQTIIAFNKSPDIPFDTSINPYRGCEHGCAYCYARITHEYLGFSAGIDFEAKIMVKESAPELLRRELSSRRWKPQVLAMSGVTDCYQPIERRLQLTRRCLAVLAEFRNPVRIVTKNQLVTRDIDILAGLAEHNAVAVNLSINSLDACLTRRLEPRASLPDHRLAAISRLTAAGIPTGVIVAPIIPALNNQEIPAVLKSARQAGAQWAETELLRLPLTVAPVFEDWLETNFPLRKAKILNQLRAMRGGKLNDPRFGHRMHGEGTLAAQLDQIFEVARRKAGFPEYVADLSTAGFRRPAGKQAEFNF